MRALEAFIGSFGILLAGIFTIPFVGGFAGVEMTSMQGLQMSLWFFFGRFLWLYVNRVFFSRMKRK